MSVSGIGPSLSSVLITHITLEVSVQQHLELEGLLALVAHVEHRLQRVLTESDGVHKTKLVRPGLPVLLREVGRAKTKVELDRVVAALGQRARLR